jgi:hypothetical protein
MPLATVKAYLTANGFARLNSILSEVFDSCFPPIDPEHILRDHTAIFCILLRMGQAIYIEDFARYEELSDRRLPFDQNHPPAEFLSTNSDPTFLRRFCEEQKAYCVPIFDEHMVNKHYGRHRLLPIVHKEPHGGEGIATQHIIKLYAPHNRLVPKADESVGFIL